MRSQEAQLVTPLTSYDHGRKLTNGNPQGVSGDHDHSEDRTTVGPGDPRGEVKKRFEDPIAGYGRRRELEHEKRQQESITATRHREELGTTSGEYPPIARYYFSHGRALLEMWQIVFLAGDIVIGGVQSLILLLAILATAALAMVLRTGIYITRMTFKFVRVVARAILPSRIYDAIEAVRMRVRKFAFSFCIIRTMWKLHSILNLLIDITKVQPNWFHGTMGSVKHSALTGVFALYDAYLLPPRNDGTPVGFLISLRITMAVVRDIVKPALPIPLSRSVPIRLLQRFFGCMTCLRWKTPSGVYESINPDSFLNQLHKRPPKDAHDNEKWFFINGICTANYTAEQCRAFLETLVQRRVTLLYNSADSVCVDLLECFFERMFKINRAPAAVEPVAVFAPSVRRALLDDKVDKVVIVCHSQGTMIAQQMLIALQRPQLMEKIGKSLSRPPANYLSHLYGEDGDVPTVPPEAWAKLELYCMGNCARELQYIKGTTPYIESLYMEHDNIAMLGCNQPPGAKGFARSNIVGPRICHPGYGHLCSRHYLGTLLHGGFRDSELHKYIHPDIVHLAGGRRSRRRRATSTSE